MGEQGSFGQGVINSHGDHRIAMSFTIAALRANGPVRILDCNNVATSCPGFAELARNCGIGLQAGSNI
jgi:3-phosphoshikimate 1-carboxyvinyltransferase